MIFNDYTFEVNDSGRGESIIFVHGSVSDLRTWEKQIKEFSKSFRTISYSRRYHWPNKKITDGLDYSMKQHVIDLKELIKSTNSKKVHLVGHSYGAFICLLLAIESPALINSLILSEPPIITLFVSNQPKPLEILKLLVTRPKTALALIKLGAKGIEPAKKEIIKGNIEKGVEIFGKATLGNEVFANLSDSRKEQVYQNVVLQEFIGSGFPVLTDKKIKDIEIKTLLINGEKSPKIFGLLLDRLMELLQNAKKTIIPKASHISHEDNFDFYNKVVLSFLKENRN